MAMSRINCNNSYLVYKRSHLCNKIAAVMEFTVCSFFTRQEKKEVSKDSCKQKNCHQIKLKFNVSKFV